MNKYYFYILRCFDETLYCGITKDLDRRLEEHNKTKAGAKYTSGRRPVKLIYSRLFANRSEASKEEARVKKLSRSEKIEMLMGGRATLGERSDS